MKMPPDYLKPVLHSIESVVVEIHQEFPDLAGADVEQVYERLFNYFKTRARGKEMEEPLSPSSPKQALIDEILNILDEREELEADSPFINDPNVTHGARMIPSLEYLYMIAFKSLYKSARFWRKKDGRKGYLSYIKNFL